MGVRLGRKGRRGKRGEGRGERRVEEEGRMIRNGGGKSGKVITCRASRDDLWAVQYIPSDSLVQGCSSETSC